MRYAAGVHICLLTTQDLDADPFPDDDWPCDPRPFLPEATWDVVVLEDNVTSRAIVRERIAAGYDLFFNLCDGADDQGLPGLEVIRTLERAGVPFTGAASSCYEPSRLKMKRVCRKLGIATPRAVMARDVADVERAAMTLRYPQIVKHPSSYASIDLSRQSRVMTPAGLRRQARKIMRRHGAALIEEFIEGGECTVLVAEHPRLNARPTAYTPVQYDFPRGETFKHSDLKWVDYDGLVAQPITDRRLARRVCDESIRFFQAMNAASFARCDIRIADDGTTYMLEINSNCGIYYPPADAGGADLCLLHDPAGHEGFTRQLVAAALARARRRTRA